MVSQDSKGLVMTSRELCNYFFESLNRTRVGNSQINQLEENECAAILFGHDEVSVDKEDSKIRLPEVGTITIGDGPDLKNIKFDWVALVKDEQVEEWNVIFGYGNPYLPQNATGLPTRNGAIVAVPSCLKKEQFFESKLPSKVGRNDLCPCRSGKKFKKCCLH
jgi:SEC-C motif